ncbi:putative disease resistance RPP13-like protein 1 isoform X2 [Malus domestica]|uniref:putative disease resistance RPP13-like protein 1 isoform X2 n=1 Tax=Malus domestica TaxID=3750 RepID=UPI0039755421
MAGAIVGGAFLSSFLNVLFDRLASRPVVDFFRGQKINSGLLNKLKIKLLSVNSVLDDAEEKQFKNPAVREWLDELKDALYAADDLLDEIKAEALRRKLEGDESSSSKSQGFLIFALCLQKHQCAGICSSISIQHRSVFVLIADASPQGHHLPLVSESGYKF